jgi:AcrR family transcriptional regulator
MPQAAGAARKTSTGARKAAAKPAAKRTAKRNPPTKRTAKDRPVAVRAVEVRTAGAPTRPVNGRRSPEDVQARILEAATAEFAESGYAGARVEQISARAKTVDRMLYYYFGNKERLYKAVLENAYAGMIAAERDFVMPRDDPARGMRELIKHTWDLYVSTPDLIRLIMNENLLRGKYIRQMKGIKQAAMPLVEVADEILQAGRKRGLFRRDVPAQTVLMTIMSLGFFYVSNQYTISQWLNFDSGEEKRRADWLRHMIEVVFLLLEPKRA